MVDFFKQIGKSKDYIINFLKSLLPLSSLCVSDTIVQVFLNTVLVTDLELHIKTYLHLFAYW